MVLDVGPRLLAEQTAMECTVVDVGEVLAGPGPAHPQLLALLGLAADTGEAAGLALLGDVSPPRPDRGHQLTTSVLERGHGLLWLSFEWRTRGYRALFDVLTGELAARPCGEGGVIASVEGTYVTTATSSAGRRAAEVAVRCFLSQIRTALEAESLPEPRSGAARW